jgi:hypothetical protein
MTRIFNRCVTLIIALGLWIAGSMEADCAITFAFTDSFSGTPPGTASPWLTATLSQFAVNEVMVTVALPNTLPPGAFLDTLYLNYDPAANASLLAVTGPGINSNNNGPATWAAGNNQFKADGDGYYDLMLSLPNPSHSAFGLSGSSTASYIIDGPANGQITPLSFYPYTSEKGGGTGQYLIAAHLQGYGNSAWLDGTVALPEPNFSSVAGLLLVPCAIIFWLGDRSRTKAKRV